MFVEILVVVSSHLNRTDTQYVLVFSPAHGHDFNEFYRPPLSVKHMNLMVCTLVGSFFWCFAPLHGLIDQRLWSSCTWDAALTLGGIAVTISSAAVRLYRLKRVLISHDVEMYTPTTQMMIVSLPLMTGFIPVVLADVLNGGRVFDSSAGMCPPVTLNPPTDSPVWLAPIFNPVLRLMMQMVPFCVVYVFMIVTTIQLRNVKSHFNEFRPMVVTLAVCIMAFATVLAGFSTASTSRIWANCVLIYFWALMAEPFYHLLKGDNAYAQQWTYGFDSLPTPDQLQKSLVNQLEDPSIWKMLHEFAGKRFSAELLEFYQAVNDRNVTVEWFTRQAKTMAIIDTFITVGSPKEVNIPGRIREEIFAGATNDPKLFDGATKEVLELMVTNLEEDFRTSDSFNALQKQSEEINRMRKAGLMTESSSATLDSAARRLPPLQKNGGSSSRSIFGMSSNSLRSRAESPLPAIRTPTSSRFSRSLPSSSSLTSSESAIQLPGAVPNEESENP